MFKLRKENISVAQIPLFDQQKTSYPLHPAATWHILPENVVGMRNHVQLPPLLFTLEFRSENFDRFLDPTGAIIAELRTDRKDEPVFCVLVNPLSVENPATVAKTVQALVAYLQSIRAVKE